MVAGVGAFVAAADTGAQGSGGTRINHYTMLFLEPGVSAFAEAVRGAAGRPARR